MTFFSVFFACSVRARTGIELIFGEFIYIANILVDIDRFKVCLTYRKAPIYRTHGAFLFSKL